MENFLHKFIKFVLVLAALGCAYGIVSSIVKPNKEHKQQESYGVSYEYKEEKPKKEEDKKRPSWDTREFVKVYGVDGTYQGSLGAGKGTYDGHTWYFFNGNPIHDPNCVCGK